MRLHRAIPSAALIAVAVLAGCQSNPAQEQAGAAVEDRTPSKPPAGSGADPRAVQQPPVARVDIGAGKTPAKSVLTDPNNILSRRSIFYNLDQFDIGDQYKDLVAAHAKFLRDNPGMKVLIQGNTDERGSREYNIGLGQRRSDGVKKMLVLLGAREDQIESVSLGEEKPRAEGAGEDIWSKNRRSDILYSGEF